MGGIRIGNVAISPDGSQVSWLEQRSGRGVVVTELATARTATDLTQDLSVRARVGYGGGDFEVSAADVFFVAEGRIYRQPLAGGVARPITPASPFLPASPTPSPDGRWVAFVYSDGQSDGLAVVDSEGRRWPQQLHDTADFYMQPAWSPGGDELLYIVWNFPHMPWDGTRLMRQRLREEGGRIFADGDAEVVTGGDGQAVSEAHYCPDPSLPSPAVLYAMEDGEWSHLYLAEAGRPHRRLTAHTRGDVMTPAWNQRQRRFGWSTDRGGRPIAFYLHTMDGVTTLHRLVLDTGEDAVVDALGEAPVLRDLAVAPQREALAVVRAADRQPPELVVLEAEAGPQVFRRARAATLPASHLAASKATSWPGEDQSPVHGLFYAPTHPDFTADGAPPLVVSVHGGPTGQKLPEFDPTIQFLTSRGYAVLAVNYRGSTGYGRSYRDALRGQWGVLDVADCASGVRAMVARGLADPSRVVIMGGSAGGYTVLESLARRPGLYTAGVSLFGLTDLFKIAAETHKLESRYLDGLVGTLPVAAAAYRDRSPVFHPERIVDPVAVFQGADDPVVPKNQAEGIVAALAARGVPHEYHLYAGEGHGWRRDETWLQFYEALDRFLTRYVVYA
jgi:dipeptidyl aminopeptidase/acylaminoacyl peptidase